jgi:multicomponent Na+:H+ antiporter subunit D
VPIVALLLLLLTCLAVGAWPGVAQALGRGAVRFLDHAGYLAQVLHGAAAGPVPIPEGTSWTLLGVTLGLVSTVLAVAVAALGLYGGAAAGRAGPLLRPFAVALGGLRRLHSGTWRTTSPGCCSASACWPRCSGSRWCSEDQPQPTRSTFRSPDDETT